MYFRKKPWDYMARKFVPADTQFEEEAAEKASQLYGFDIDTLGKCGGHDGDVNIYIHTIQLENFVLKVSPPELSWGAVEGEDKLLRFLNHIIAQKEYAKVASNVPSLTVRLPTAEICGKPGYKIRLTKFLNGVPMDHMEKYHWYFLKNVSRACAFLCMLMGAHDEEIKNERAPKFSVEGIKEYLKDCQLKGVEEFLEEYENDFYPTLLTFNLRPIHGDLDTSNIIVDAEDESIQGLAEFGHCCYGYIGFDLGSLMLSVLMDKHKIIYHSQEFEGLGDVFLNFCKEASIKQKEASWIYFYMGARAAYLLHKKPQVGKKAWECLMLYGKQLSEYVMDWLHNFKTDKDWRTDYGNRENAERRKRELAHEEKLRQWKEEKQKNNNKYKDDSDDD